MGPLSSLDASITQHLNAIRTTGFDAPAGGSPSWDGLLRHYGIAPFADAERTMIVQGMQLTRGAVPAEVRVVFQSLVAWATGELDRIAPSAPPEGVAALRARLSSLVDTETSAYERSIGLAPPPPAAPPQAALPGAPSVASIFANAESSAKQVPWANMKYKQVNSLTCVHCGAPQEQPLDFMCAYCRRPIAGKLVPTT